MSKLFKQHTFRRGNIEAVIAFDCFSAGLVVDWGCAYIGIGLGFAVIRIGDLGGCV